MIMITLMMMVICNDDDDDDDNDDDDDKLKSLRKMNHEHMCIHARCF